MWIGLIWVVICMVMNHRVALKYVEFDWLRSCYVLKKDSAPWSQLLLYRMDLL
jgi:hypothetical protein